MKVLLIDVNCKYSSTGKIVYDLYTELNNQGHEAAICYGRGPIITEKNIFKFGIDLETYFHAFMTRITGLTGIYSPFSTRRLINYIEEFKPDVVHMHELHGYFVNISPIINYLKRKNIKTIWTFHCEFMYTGKCGHAFECDKWQSVCDKCPQLYEYPKSIFFDFTKKMFLGKKRLFDDFENLTIVTPSKWLAERVERSFLSNKKVEVINNGIDTKTIFFPRESNCLREKHNIVNKHLVLAVAPNIMSEAKGGEWILKFARGLKNEDILFIIIGVDKPNEISDNNILALGRISDQNILAQYYSIADLFLICSKRENYPTTCLEAISCGTPVVGFKSGGTEEIVSQEVGDLVEYGSYDKMIEVIRDYLKRKMKAKKKEKLIEYSYEYSKEYMYKNYFQLYLK